MKRYLIPWLAALAIPSAVNAEDISQTITTQNELNTLSEYGIIDLIGKYAHSIRITVLIFTL